MICTFEDTMNQLINSFSIQMSNSIAVQSSDLAFFFFYDYIDLSIEGDQWGDQFSHKNSRLEIINIYS